MMEHGMMEMFMLARGIFDLLISSKRTTFPSSRPKLVTFWPIVDSPHHFVNKLKKDPEEKKFWKYVEGWQNKC